MDNIGQRLKVERQLRGWSQRDLARETQVNTDTISGIETGQHEPRPSTLRKLAEGLGIEVRDLFLESAFPKAPAREAGQPKSAKTPQVTREQFEEHDIPASENEISEVNQLLTDFWHQVKLGEKTSAFFPPQTEVDWRRVILLLNYVLNRPDIFGLAPEDAEEIHELVKTA